MKKTILILAVFSLIFSSCIPGNVKKELSKSIRKGQELFADQDFKKAIGYIELHRLRFGDYPKSLRELKFLGQMDSTIFHSVEYTKLEEGYELNLTTRYSSMDSTAGDFIHLNYPDEFWQGLGCKHSNIKSDNNL